MSVPILAALACAPPTTWTSDPASTDVGPWRRATVSVVFTPAHTVHPLNGAAYHAPDALKHTLTLEPAAGPNVASVTLLQLRDAPETAARLTSERQTRYSVRFSPDGQALALSTDGRAWTMVELGWVDTPLEEPLWCTHRTASSLDPWPSSRAVVLELLAEAHPDFAGVRIHTDAARNPLETSGPGAVPANSGHRELRGAVLYACAHREDDGLRAALVDGFVQPGIGALTVPGDDSIVARCLGDLARAEPAVLQALQGARARLQPTPPARDLTDVGRIDDALFQAGVAP